MFDFLTDIPFVSLFIKFMIASTVLLSAVWLMEKTRLINTPDLAELAWKLAIAGSFLALLPFADIMSSTLVIQDNRTAALIDEINQNRPFSAFAASPKTDAATNNMQAQDFAADQKSPLESLQETILKKEIPNSEARISTDQTINTAAEIETAPILQTENDSESTKTTFWYSAADLRTKDLAALGWVALALLTLSALMISYRDAVKNLGSRKRVHAENKANQLLRAICEKADIRHVPYLSRSDAIKSPVCLPRKEICLPDWAFDDMPKSEFKSLLAHELGHMVRRDPIMLMALQILSRTFFFQPMFIIARKRLTDIAELAADEWAANQAADSRSVANALFTCATKIHETRQIQWGLAMAGNKSILKQRVERLIDAQSVPFKTAGTFAKITLGVGVIGLSLGLPSVEFAGAMTAENSMGQDINRSVLASTATKPVVAPSVSVAPLPGVTPLVSVTPQTPNITTSAKVAPFAAVRATGSAASTAATHPHNRHFSRNSDDNSGNIRWSEGDKSISVKWEGDFRINDSDDFIIAEDEDGFLRIKGKDGSVKHSIKFEVKDGKRIHAYYKGGKKQDLDNDGKKWLKQSIRLLINSGFGAEERVARILKKNKVKAVLKEIKSFDSDFIRRIYLAHLMDQASLKDRDILEIVNIVAKFDSDFEKRLTLSSLLEEEDVSDKILPKVLGIAKGFDSDFEKRLLVTHYASKLKLTDKSTDIIIEIADSLDSDFELRLLLASTLSDAKLSDSNVEKIFDMAVKNMDSDFEKRLMLTTFANQFKRSDKAVSRVLAATNTMDSDFETRLMLSALVGKGELNQENWLTAIKIAADIDSDFEKSLALGHMRSEIPKGYKKVVAALDEAMKDIDQHYSDNRNSFLAEREFFSHDQDESRAKRDIARAKRDQKRAARDEARMHRDLERAKAEMLREIKREYRNAIREMDRQIRGLQRELSDADTGMKVELKRMIKQLETSKKELEKQFEIERSSAALEFSDALMEPVLEAMQKAQIAAQLALKGTNGIREELIDRLALEEFALHEEFKKEMLALQTELQRLQYKFAEAGADAKAEMSRRIQEIAQSKKALAMEFEFEQRRRRQQAENSKSKTDAQVDTNI